VAKGSVFAAGKTGKDRLREIWDGGRLSAEARPPPKPPWLISPTSLAHLEATPTRPIWLSKKDGSCFFDQLMLPAQLCNFMGRPEVRVDELIGVEAMTLEEILSHLPDAERENVPVTVTLVNRTWAMGFAWSSFVAQSVMTGCCLQTGIDSDCFLADEKKHPA
jgi:hypothetical protein